MKALSIELPDKVAIELDQLVTNGWFANQSEIIRLALLEFVRRHHFALIEQFQREDIEWALQQSKEKKE